MDDQGYPQSRQRRLALPARLGLFCGSRMTLLLPFFLFTAYVFCALLLFVHRSARHQSAGLRKGSLHWPIWMLFGVLAFRNNSAIPYCMFFVPGHQRKKQVALDLLFAFLLLRFDSATMPDSAT